MARDAGCDVKTCDEVMRMPPGPRLVLVFGSSPRPGIFRNHEVRIDREGSVAQHRAAARDAASSAEQHPTVCFTSSEHFVSELSCCVMRWHLRKPRAVDPSRLFVFDFTSGRAVPVEVSRHGFRIESVDEEICQLSADMQDLFAELEGVT